jgi:hypothetical protein
MLRRLAAENVVSANLEPGFQVHAYCQLRAEF